jgi:hypothetical protein
MGYECEVSQGDLDTSNDDPTIDMDNIRETFDRQFEYDQNKFLRDNFRGAIDIVKTFEVEFIYGYAKDTYQKPLSSLLSLANSRFEYKVMKFSNPEANTLEYVKPIIFLGPSGLRQFQRDNNADNYDIKQVIDVSTKYCDLVTKFISKYKISVPVIDVQINQLVSYINESTDNESTEEDSEKLIAVYYIGKQIAYINNQFKLLYNAMEGTDIYSSNIGVLDENGALVLLKMDNYEEGLLNPLVKDFDSEAFDNDYEAARESVYDSEFDDFIENYRENNSSSTSNIVETIHDYVVSDVDDKAEFSSDYHSSTTSEYRGKVTIVESDSSISPPGAEIVSPVFNGLPNSFVWLDKVFDMIEHRGMETNRSTGLHVNIGTFKAIHIARLDDKLGINSNKPVIDMVKLAVLSGDHYLLEQFDRLGNSYALSISSNIRDLAQSNFDFKEARKSGMTDIINDLNRKLITGQGDRYRTINMQHLLEKGYLEFRIAGGEDYHSDKTKVKKAVYRYVQLCAIACDPQAYFKEYMTELYRLFVDNTNPADIQVGKTPRPKNVQEAMYIIRAWSSKYMEGGNGALPAAPKDRIRDAIAKGQSAIETDILDMIAGIDTKLYPKVDANFLYAVRLLMLYSAKDRPNPRQYLRDNWNKYHNTSIKNYLAPKMYKNKPQWLRFFFTGSTVGVETAQGDIT